MSPTPQHQSHLLTGERSLRVVGGLARSCPSQDWCSHKWPCSLGLSAISPSPRKCPGCPWKAKWPERKGHWESGGHHKMLLSACCSSRKTEHLASARILRTSHLAGTGDHGMCRGFHNSFQGQRGEGALPQGRVPSVSPRITVFEMLPCAVPTSPSQ